MVKIEDRASARTPSFFRRDADRASRPAPVPETSSTAPLAGPLIYYVSPLLIGPAVQWTPLLQHVAGLGFDTLLLAPPFRPGRSGNLFDTADHDRVHPLLAAGAGDEIESFIGPLANSAKAFGLKLCLDLAVDRLAGDARLLSQHPDWFLKVPRRSERLPDPRHPPAPHDLAHPRFDDAGVADGMASYFADLASRLVQLGVGGFRCTAPARVPSRLWRRVIEAAKQAGAKTRFFAWTPGVPPEAIHRLADAGFDHSFASTPWWDMTSPWLIEEYEARRLSLPPIGLVEDPAAERLAAQLQDLDVESKAPALRRRLLLAGVSGCGYMMPMGYEFAALSQLDMTGGRPGDWQWLQAEHQIDLSSDVIGLNALLRRERVFATRGAMRLISSPGSSVSALERADAGDVRAARRLVLVLINADDRLASLSGAVLTAHTASRFENFAPIGGSRPLPLAADMDLSLEPREVALLAASRAPAPSAGPKLMMAAEAARRPRLVIENISPSVDEPGLAVKRIAGQMMQVEADIFADGHEKLRAVLLWRAAGSGQWRESEMSPLGNDRWHGEFPLQAIGRHLFTIEAWRDLFATWRDEVEKKHAAGLPLALEIREGLLLVEQALARSEAPEAAHLQALLERLAAAGEGEALSLLFAAETTELMRRFAPRVQTYRHPAEQHVMADRPEAEFASWYELFPRSQSGDAHRHGSFDDVIARLPAIRAMGFDVLYFPPIHPIGRKNRKGRNNTLTPSESDPGSPYAIGGPEGGHDAVHPDLGGLPAFRRLLAAAAEHGLEIALDFAIQCSPDHPWLKQHPGWFAWRPDGSLRYAENPPKKYEDIVNVDFYADEAVPSLWQALRDVVMFWADEGVRTFRVDNPHTKPLPFWQWLIADVQRSYPDAIFLAEAFTRPKMMKRLGKIGFTQSYTYFTWRNSKAELQEYLTELTTTDMRDYYRPHFFVNTPDINPYFLQGSGRAGHLIRAALAATLSGLWGVYSGFELCEARALPGKEEYLDSEKYEIRAWDWQRPGNIVAEIGRLNRIRRDNPALHSHLGLSFLNCWNDNVLCYRKATASRDNLLVIAVSTDPQHLQEASFEIPLWDFGLPDQAEVAVEDLLRERHWTWSGKTQRLRLDPHDLPYAIWRLKPLGAAERS